MGTSYTLVNQQLKALIGEERNLIANLSNAAALLNMSLKDINWVGFYLYEEETDELVLGPFQGKTACVRIPNGKGVCGTSFRSEQPLIVVDVHQFPGHIACDTDSESEIVLPLIKNGTKIGVLDIDAPVKGRFTEKDQKGLTEFVQILVTTI